MIIRMFPGLVAFVMFLAWVWFGASVAQWITALGGMLNR